ncbi:formate hydrogenlyase regulator HycA [Pluralibacter gergoviae]|uniref:Formate hydrogenlyase regulator HycA n=1 Tax=Pluralibacter gergoviae TaxID=61647 RepID=A0AAW8HU45_PLUGE|nr:formate hydrogenlyase regulator HycA [Pluralibacter gergoviae]AVR05632.1 transcriptional regulator [Pluralibacter gergoviae]EKT9641105.1 formate hydrogenlyase regulator HycA [Pluralibacter gergoviae]EKV0930849.1 formate hydrogenlyase regulator HycA [Pluralibacter gergoviae]EKV3546330.1 formate hydrogenlyase regulator HycA [Pluralibacter gergoviae]EKV9901396.1 formate hydrogenlyase regulator HycA [Pluralibacter gergoviae]
MTIWEMSEKADYIADRHRRQQKLWHSYCNSLVQGITLSKARLHHAVSGAPSEGVSFVLFEHFIIHVTLDAGFNSHTIHYSLATRDGDERQPIGQAHLGSDGTVDDGVNCHDREQVLAHYLDKIEPVYQRLYDALENDRPVRLAQLMSERVEHA